MSSIDAVPCYANGDPYRPVYGGLSEAPRPPDCRYDKVLSLTSNDLTWGRFWQIISAVLTQHGYSHGSRQLYRAVMRNFYRFSRQAPAKTDTAIIDAYVDTLVDHAASWNWIAMNICVLRTVFDKLAGQSLTCHLCTPKRPESLPDILSPGEVRRILAAAPSTRDQLLLGLMYGCGLKVGEVCQLTWADIDTDNWSLTARATNGTRERALEIPPDLHPVLAMGKSRCPSPDFIFQGRVAGTHLSTRMVELIVRKAAKGTNTLKTVTCMTLRHSFAVHSLENGESARALQEALGHLSIETTLRYQDCILPAGVVSPLDALRLSSPILITEPRGGAAPLRGPNPKTEPSGGEPPLHGPILRREPRGGEAPLRGPILRREPRGGEAPLRGPILEREPRGGEAPLRGPAPDQQLFDDPLSVEPLELPFGEARLGHDLAQTFQNLLRSHTIGRFLCWRGTSPHPN